MAPDFYKVLGVSESAGESEITKAYRKLAVQHHPDKNPSDKQAEERFKEIAEAYATVRDPSKRRQYDHVRCSTPASADRSPKTPGSTVGSDFEWWGRSPGDGPGNPFANRRPPSSCGSAWSGFCAEEQPRRRLTTGAFAPRSSSAGAGVGHPAQDFSLGEALGLFNVMFAGRDPFSEFTDGFGTPSGSSRLSTSRSIGSGYSWDMKVMKVKKPDGSVIVERIGGRTGQCTRSCSGDSQNSGGAFRGFGDFRSETFPRQQKNPRTPGAGTDCADFATRRHATPPGRDRSSGSRAPLMAGLSITDGRPATKIAPHQLPPAGGIGGGGAGIGRGSWPDAGGGCGLGNMGSRGAFVGWTSK